MINIIEIFFLTIIIYTDFKKFMIYDKILLPFMIIEIIFAINQSVLEKIFYAGICASIFLLLAIITKNIGGGDIKLAIILGFIFCSDIFAVIVIACISAISFILIKQKRRSDLIPFGAFLSISAIMKICLNCIL